MCVLTAPAPKDYTNPIRFPFCLNSRLGRPAAFQAPKDGFCQAHCPTPRASAPQSCSAHVLAHRPQRARTEARNRRTESRPTFSTSKFSTRLLTLTLTLDANVRPFTVTPNPLEQPRLNTLVENFRDYLFETEPTVRTDRRKFWTYPTTKPDRRPTPRLEDSEAAVKNRFWVHIILAQTLNSCRVPQLLQSSYKFYFHDVLTLGRNAFSINQSSS